MIRIDDPSTASTPASDPVTRYLCARGLTPAIAYLGESHFELGRRIVWDALDLTYRYERGALLLCDVSAHEAGGDVAGAIRRLAALIHAIERDVPEVVRVEGLVPNDGDGEDAVAAQRLLAVYRRLGAQCREDARRRMTAVTYVMRQSLQAGQAPQSQPSQPSRGGA